MKACQKEKISIIPYSGGTGLVGGQVDPRHEASVILSTERMKNIRDFYVDEKVIIVESGVILEHLQEEVSKNNLYTMNQSHSNKVVIINNEWGAII